MKQNLTTHSLKRLMLGEAQKLRQQAKKLSLKIKSLVASLLILAIRLSGMSIAYLSFRREARSRTLKFKTPNFVRKSHAGSATNLSPKKQ